MNVAMFLFGHSGLKKTSVEWLLGLTKPSPRDSKYEVVVLTFDCYNIGASRGSRAKSCTEIKSGLNRVISRASGG